MRPNLDEEAGDMEHTRSRAAAPAAADPRDDLWDVALAAADPLPPVDSHDCGDDEARPWTADYEEVE